MSNSGIMTKEIVLKLGADWRPIGKSTVEKAFVELVSGAVRAVDIRYAVQCTRLGDGSVYHRQGVNRYSELSIDSQADLNQ